MSLTVNGSNLFALADGHVFLSTNNGTSWTEVNNDNGYVQALAVSGKNIFTVTYNNGVFLSSNNGSSWTKVDNGLPNKSVYAFAVSGKNLFAGTWGEGVWRRPLLEMITSVEEPFADRRLPENISLEQNCPNPFNPTTTIAFYLPSSSFVTLKVFNSAGKEVVSLVHRQLPVGNHRMEWNASAVPSGIYFYRIQAGNYSETKNSS